MQPLKIENKLKPINLTVYQVVGITTERKKLLLEHNVSTAHPYWKYGIRIKNCKKNLKRHSLILLSAAILKLL